MSSIDHVPEGARDDIDLVALWRIIWDSKYFIAVIAGLCAVTAMVFALVATPIYRAQVVVTEVTDQNMGGLASLANQFGGLASLAGINLSASDSSREARAILESRYLPQEFISRRNLIPALFPKAAEPPTLWFAVKHFRESVLTIRSDDGLTRISIDWTDPVVATNWANDFVALANEVVRTRALDGAKRNIAYLKQQILQTDVVELRSVMYKLIESETKTLMIANGKTEYAFTVVDPAVPPEIRISPQRTLMVLAGGFVGLVIGAIIAIFRNSLRRWRRAVP